MTIAEGSAAAFYYKFYSSGTMVAGTEADTTTAPGASSATVLRRVSSSLNLRTNQTRSNEILPSRQIRSSRRTSRRVEGSITGELSPGTYFPFIEAVHRDTRVTTGTESTSIVPATGHVKRKVAIERYNSDLDRSRLYTECRVTGYRITIPAEGIATFECMFMGRNRTTRSGASAPYFTSPTDANSQEVCNALNGSLTVGGTAVGVVTAADISVSLNAEAPNVVGQKFPPDILLGLANVTGNMTFLLDDADTATAAFEAETEVAVVLALTNADSGGNTITITLPRIKLIGGDENVQGEGSQLIQCPFQALEATTGGTLSTISVADTSLHS